MAVEYEIRYGITKNHYCGTIWIGYITVKIHFNPTNNLIKISFVSVVRQKIIESMTRKNNKHCNCKNILVDKVNIWSDLLTQLFLFWWKKRGSYLSSNVSLFLLLHDTKRDIRDREEKRILSKQMNVGRRKRKTMKCCYLHELSLYLRKNVLNRVTFFILKWCDGESCKLLSTVKVIVDRKMLQCRKVFRNLG